MSAQPERLKQKTIELIFLKKYLASFALLLSLTAILFSLLAIRFNNASGTADESTLKLTITKLTLLANLVVWKVVSFLISISKTSNLCRLAKIFGNSYPI